jgi:hypothetical protein
MLPTVTGEAIPRRVGMPRARPHGTGRTARAAAVAGLVVLLASVLAACGSDRAAAPVALPPTGHAYRALSADDRLAVAASCRDRAAARASGTAARQLRAIDAKALRDQLDDAFSFIPDQRRPVAAVCAQRLPFVTPGVQLRFAGARGGGDRFTYETDSDIPLTMRGRITPAPRGGRVVATRETGGRGRYVTTVDASGRFVIAGIHLRKIADNTFTVTVDAPPNAPHKVHFSAICLDCLAGAPPPTPR